MAACGNDIEKTKIFERQILPASTITNANIKRSENGKLQMLMEAPVVEKFTQPDAKTVYPKGVNIRFFSGYNNPTGVLKARYAVQYEGRDETFLRDSVVIIDLRRGDTVYLQDLTWNSMQHRIFTDKPLRSKNGQRVTFGDGFESDDQFVAPLITHQRGTFEWNEE